MDLIVWIFGINQHKMVRLWKSLADPQCESQAGRLTAGNVSLVPAMVMSAEEAAVSWLAAVLHPAGATWLVERPWPAADIQNWAAGPVSGQ